MLPGFANWLFHLLSALWQPRHRPRNLMRPISFPDGGPENILMLLPPSTPTPQLHQNEYVKRASPLLNETQSGTDGETPPRPSYRDHFIRRHLPLRPPACAGSGARPTPGAASCAASSGSAARPMKAEPRIERIGAVTRRCGPSWDLEVEYQ